MALRRRTSMVAVVLLSIPTVAYAQAANMGQSDAILRALQAAANAWNGAAVTLGMDLLAGLAVVTFVLSVGFASMAEGSVNPVALGALLIRHMVFFGFWVWLLRNWQNYGHAIIASFQTAAQQMGGPPMTPVAVMEQGGDLAAGMWQQTSLLHPGAAVGLSVAAICIFVLFAITAGLMLMSLAKAFVTVGVGSLYMGFSGFPETKHLAMNAVLMTIGAGSRLFMIELIAGLAGNVLKSLTGQNTVLGQDNTWGVIGLGIVVLILMFSLPSMAEHMGGGTGHSRAGPGELMRTLNNAASMAINAGSGGSAMAARVASAGRSMMASLPSGGGIGGNSGGGASTGAGLPAPANFAASGGSGSSAASPSSGSAGARMQPSNARFSRRS